MKYIHDFKVVETINLNDDHFVINVKLPEKLPEIIPGQFAEVLVANSSSTFLRRPISIHNVDFENNIVSMFVKRVGEGTRHLGLLKKGDTLNMVYPLGNSFSLPKDNNFMLIGGGCGVAPLLFLANYLHKAGFKPTVLIGASSKNDIHELELFEKYAKVLTITIDGSMGEKGLITEHSIFRSSDFGISKFFVCGPEPMLKAVAKIAAEKGVECEVSLENTMACGIGACLCCVVDTKQGNKCVCTEGPIFNINDLRW